MVLRSTATSWRSTSSSMSFDDGARVSSISPPRSRLKISRACVASRPGIMPGVWDVDRCRSQARADFWNPTCVGAGAQQPRRGGMPKYVPGDRLPCREGQRSSARSVQRAARRSQPCRAFVRLPGRSVASPPPAAAAARSWGPQRPLARARARTPRRPPRPRPRPAPRRPRAESNDVPPRSSSTSSPPANASAITSNRFAASCRTTTPCARSPGPTRPPPRVRRGAGFGHAGSSVGKSAQPGITRVRRGTSPRDQSRAPSPV